MDKPLGLPWGVDEERCCYEQAGHCAIPPGGFMSQDSKAARDAGELFEERPEDIIGASAAQLFLA
jgi:hypothetical protein